MLRLTIVKWLLSKIVGKMKCRVSIDSERRGGGIYSKITDKAGHLMPDDLSAKIH